MYNLMIVEDDALYRNELRSFLDWKACGFQLVCEAINGKDALKKMKSCIPDLIITDISMPEMNGIELIQTLHAQYPQIWFLVLSSYDDFTFVKDAMKLGAQDYILKYTVTEQEMSAMMSNMKARMDHQREELDRSRLLESNVDQIKDNYLKKALLGGDVQGLSSLWKILGLHGAPEHVAVISLMTEDLSQERFGLLREKVENDLEAWEFWVQLAPRKASIVCFIQRKDGHLRLIEYIASGVKEMVQILHVLGSTRYAIGVSDILPGVPMLPEAYRQAETALAQNVYEGYDKAFFYASINKSSHPLKLEDLREKILEDMQEGQFPLVRRELREYMEDLSEARPEMDALRMEIMLLYNVLYRAAIEEKVPFYDLTGHKIVSERLLEGCASLRDLRNSVLTAFDCFMQQVCLKENKPVQDARTGNKYIEKYIDEIMDYIDQNYMREISLSVLSKQTNLTPNYLCRLFRSSTGIKLTDYINRVRVEGAKKLLMTTNLKVYEVAESVGFSSASYFCTVFKNVTGIKVSEYKEEKSE